LSALCRIFVEVLCPMILLHKLDKLAGLSRKSMAEKQSVKQTLFVNNFGVE